MNSGIWRWLGILGVITLLAVVGLMLSSDQPDPLERELEGAAETTAGRSASTEVSSEESGSLGELVWAATVTVLVAVVGYLILRTRRNSRQNRPKPNQPPFAGSGSADPTSDTNQP